MSDFPLTKLILDVDGIKRTAKDAGRPREKNPKTTGRREARKSKDFGL